MSIAMHFSFRSRIFMKIKRKCSAHTMTEAFRCGTLTNWKWTVIELIGTTSEQLCWYVFQLWCLAAPTMQLDKSVNDTHSTLAVVCNVSTVSRNDNWSETSKFKMSRGSHSPYSQWFKATRYPWSRMLLTSYKMMYLFARSFSCSVN